MSALGGAMTSAMHLKAMRRHFRHQDTTDPSTSLEKTEVAGGGFSTPDQSCSGASSQSSNALTEGEEASDDDHTFSAHKQTPDVKPMPDASKQ